MESFWLNSYIVKPLEKKKSLANTLEAEAGLYNEFQNSQSHIMKPCLKNKKEKIILESILELWRDPTKPGQIPGGSPPRGVDRRTSLCPRPALLRPLCSWASATGPGPPKRAPVPLEGRYKVEGQGKLCTSSLHGNGAECAVGEVSCKAAVIENF